MIIGGCDYLPMFIIPSKKILSRNGPRGHCIFLQYAHMCKILPFSFLIVSVPVSVNASVYTRVYLHACKI